LWTSFWYIPSFVITLLLLFILKSNSENRSTVLVMLIFTLQILLIHYQNLNPHFYLNDILGEQFNILLSNSINKFHPALFYISLLLITVSYPNSLYLPKLRYSLKRDYREFTYFTNKLTRIIIFTLFLGSWWALQEGSWGGWWNWDPSEVFGMVVMLLHLNSLHRKSCIGNHTDSLYYTSLVWKFILLIYIFIQFNFDLVSHNFGTRVDQFIDSSHNFLLLLLLISLTISWNYICLIHSSVSTNSLLINQVGKRNISWNLLLYGFILFIVLSSFSLLINDFFWKVLQINILNSTKLTYYFTPVLVTLILLRVWNLFIILPIVYSMLNNPLLLTLLLPLSVRPVNSIIFHNFIIIILLGMCIEYNQTVSLWDLVSENASLQFGSLTSDLFGAVISLNNFFIEYTKPELLNNSLTECVWNIIWTSSSPENHNFGHPLTSYYLSQVLLSGNTLSQYLIVVLDLAVTSTTILLIPLSYLFIQLINKTKIITF
jgi:cytochrome c biogenesis factor